MSRRSRDAWLEEADALLADGKWHDGLTWMLAVEKEIMPGIAQRKTEQDRVRITLRRMRRLREQELGRPLTEDELSQLEVGERTRPLSMGAQIAAGKRSLVVHFVHTRVRMRAYEVEPWPMPEGGWKAGGWRLRRPARWSPSLLQGRYNLAQSTIRALILQAPALRHMTAGRILYVYDEELPALEERIKAYREGSTERRREGMLERWQRAGQAPITHYSVTALAERGGLAVQTAQRLRRAHPELGWVKRGRVTRLPIEQLPEWERIVKDFKASRE